MYGQGGCCGCGHCGAGIKKKVKIYHQVLITFLYFWSFLSLFLCVCIEVASQLAAAEVKCTLLEKQLDLMKRTVRSTESDRTAVLKHQVVCVCLECL